MQNNISQNLSGCLSSAVKVKACKTSPCTKKKVRLIESHGELRSQLFVIDSNGRA